MRGYESSSEVNFETLHAVLSVGNWANTSIGKESVNQSIYGYIFA